MESSVEVGNVGVGKTKLQRLERRNRNADMHIVLVVQIYEIIPPSLAEEGTDGVPTGVVAAQILGAWSWRVVIAEVMIARKTHQKCLRTTSI